MIKKIGILFLLLGLACYFIIAVTFFNQPKDGLMCSDVTVVVDDSLQTGFIQAKQVEDLLKKSKCHPEGKKMSDVSLAQIEDVLKKNAYIQDATSYKTPGGKVCISIVQRLPILYVMPNKGNSYYLDRSGKQMPKQTYSANLVVATGFITPQYARQNLMALGRYIQDNPFWNNQIEQINVLENGKVELIPRVGEHTILLGRPNNIDDKLSRMKIFYTEGLNKVGWNKYSTINLEYNDQIICKKKKI